MAKNKGKIAIFHCAFIYSGGGERYIFEEIKGLKKLGYDVVCFGHVLDKKNCFPDLIGNYNIKTFLPQFPRWMPLRYAFTIALSFLLSPLFAYQFKDVDIFFGADQPAIWTTYWVARVLKKPFMVFMNHPNRGVYPRIQEGKVQPQTELSFRFLFRVIKLICPLFVYLDKISVRGARSHLVVSKNIGKEIEKIYGVKTILCSAGALPISHSSLPKSSKEAYQGEFIINDFKIKKPYIFCAGRHEKWKRFDYVIRALSLILKKVSNVSLVIPGPPTNHTPDLLKLVSKLKLKNKVLFLGKVTEKELNRLYKEAALFAFTSPKEDFGTVVIESMAKGVPVVAWNYGGPTDTIVNNINGYLSKPYIISDYAEKMIDLLSNPKKRLAFGIAAHRYVKENFSWDKHISIIKKELKKIEKEIS